MRVSVSTPGGFTLSTGSSPDVAPAWRDSIYAETERTSAVFTTVIEP
jgi:hypothetical protein